MRIILGLSLRLSVLYQSLTVDAVDLGFVLRSGTTPVRPHSPKLKNQEDNTG